MKHNAHIGISIRSHLLILAFTLLSVLLQGHQFGLGNQTFYIAWIRSINNPNFIPTDWYLSTPIPHPNILYLMANAANLISMYWTFCLAHLITRYLLCLGVYRLARTLFKEETTAFLSVILCILSPRIALGGHHIQGGHFEANFLGFSLAILCISFLFERRFLLAAALLGATIHFHLFIGAHILVIFAFCLLREIRASQLRWGAAAGYLMFSLVISSFTWISSAFSFLTEPKVISGQEVTQILCFRHPHHHSPFTWELSEVVLFLLYVGVGVVLIFKRRHHQNAYLRILYIYIAAVCLLHLIFVEIVPLSFVAYFQSFRITALLMLFTTLYLSEFIVAHVFLKPFSIFSFWCFLLVALFRFPHAFLIIFSVGMVSLLGCPRRAIWKMARILVFSLCFLLFVVITNLLSVPYEKHLIIGIAVALPLFLLFQPLYKIRLNNAAAVMLSILAVISAALLLDQAIHGRCNRFVEKMGRSNHFRTSMVSPNPEFQELCEWISGNTSPRSVFLVPPAEEGFRIIAERACVIDWRSMTFTNQTIQEWFERITDVCGLGLNGRGLLDNLHAFRRSVRHPGTFLTEQYRSLREPYVNELQKKYHFDYMVAPVEMPLTFPVVYRNGNYTLYHVK